MVGSDHKVGYWHRCTDRPIERLANRIFHQRLVIAAGPRGKASAQGVTGHSTIVLSKVQHDLPQQTGQTDGI